jgi:hypothetical protein
MFGENMAGSKRCIPCYEKVKQFILMQFLRRIWGNTGTAGFGRPRADTVDIDRREL